jgi:hypothetical protein
VVTVPGAGARLVGKVLLAGAGAVASALLAAHAAKLWQPRREVVVGLVAATAALAVVSSVTAAVGEYRRQRAESRRNDVAFLLVGAAWDIADLTGIDPRELGLAVYLVRRERVLPWRRRLVRLHRERAKRRVSSSDIVWRPGKGVIGTCVVRGQDLGQDLHADYGSIGDCTREEWDSTIPETIKLGLTYDEFLHVRGKYGAVLASPIIDDTGTASRILGCVALDGPPQSFQRLQRRDARAVLADTATSLVRWVL